MRNQILQLLGRSAHVRLVRNGNVYLLTSEFDDELDEYPDEYEVFAVPATQDASGEQSWTDSEFRTG